MSKPKIYYTIYNDTTDEIIAYGTRQECMEKLHMTSGSFSSMISNMKNKANRKYRQYAVVTEYIDQQQSSDDYDSSD